MEKLKYSYTLADLKDYVKYQYKIPRVKKYITKGYFPLLIVDLIALIIVLIPAIMNFISATVYFAKGEMPPSDFVDFLISWSWYYLPIALIFIIVCIIIFGICWLINSKDLFSLNSKKLYNTFQGRSKDCELELNENGLFFSNSTGNTNIEWKGIIDVHTSEKSIFVFIGDYQSIIIPKRAFNTPEQAQEFIDLVQKKIKLAKES